MGWIGRWRRAQVLRRSRLDAHAWAACLARFSFMRCLPPADQARLHDLVVLFLNEKSLQGAGGLRLTTAMRLHIAAQACLLILGLDLDYYRDWVEVIVYPDAFVADYEAVDAAGVVTRVRVPASGEAWIRGPVILSWRDANAADGGFGYNVVMHEFAHKIDMLNGAADGFPPLHDDMSRGLWTTVFDAAFSDFRRRVEARAESGIDPYAAEDAGEFFAVLSELFFEKPETICAEFPAVYRQLTAFYRQDPAARMEAAAA